MSLEPNPSDPLQPNPYFQDNSFVRGTQLRNALAVIWRNFLYLIGYTDSAVALIPFRNFTRITSSQTWNNPGVSKVFLRSKGGGGGGTGGANPSFDHIGCGGGSSGEERFGFFNIAGNLSIAIGAGGAGGVGGNSSTNGGDGGDTTISDNSGNIMTAKGGKGAIQWQAAGGRDGAAPASLGNGGTSNGSCAGASGTSIVGSGNIFAPGGIGGGLNGGRRSLTSPKADNAVANSGDGGCGGGCATSFIVNGGDGAAGYVDIYY